MAGRAATPNPQTQLAQSAAAGASRHDPALAPRPRRTPPRRGVAAPPAGPAAHRTLDPHPDTAPGGGEPVVGVSTDAPHERGNGAMGTDLPPGAARPHPDLEPTPPAAGTARVRDL